MFTLQAAPLNDQREQHVYDIVVRHFLACLSRDAKGKETTVDITIGGENFSAKGLVIHDRGFYEVYHPYANWSSKTIPNFEEGQQFDPDTIEMADGETSPPELLTEADLLTLMDRNEIGIVPEVSPSVFG